VETTGRHELVAHNTATASGNKIHDDEVAKRYGFGGGLVPGVDVYAYMTWPAAEAWGLDWLARGTMRARFTAPVYEGERVVASATPAAPAEAEGDGLALAIELRAADGSVRAAGVAGLPAAPIDPPPVATWPVVAPGPGGPTGGAADRRPEASPSSLAVGTALAIAAHRFHADQAEAYLADVRDDLPLYRSEGVAHPGWLLRDANHVLGANVALGPWIHVESQVRHHALVRDGEAVRARAVVTRQWEHKGHRFVELDVGLIVGGSDDGGGHVAARVTHTAIYRPRPPAGA
jgi:acyl dehydratase